MSLPEGELFKFSHKMDKVKKRKNPVLVGIILISIITSLALIYLSLNSVLLEKGYQLQSLKNDVKALQDKVEKLKLEVQQLSHLDRIERIATNNLEMDLPEEREIIYLWVPGEKAERNGKKKE